jgi:D-serine ammonia-lyase
VNDAAKAALSHIASGELQKHTQPFVLSVGATPTAHAFSSTNLAKLKSLLSGKLELHAGNYPMLDLQQTATSLVSLSDVAQRIVSSVVSVYPGRGVDGGDEALCDAGAIAFSKDAGPITGVGAVVGVFDAAKKSSRADRLEESGWRLGRVSQEHGILVQTGTAAAQPLNFGAFVEIIGPHACLAAAAFPWYYVVDSEDRGSFGDRVMDVWVPWKGW